MVRSKVNPVEKKVGCRGCGNSWCQVCKSINITDEFTNFTTKKAWKINHSFDCNDKCLFYLLSCKTYVKQYIGNTADHFRSRWSNLKNDIRKAEDCNTENVNYKFLESHYLQSDHQGFLNDVEVRLIDMTVVSAKKNGNSQLPQSKINIK